jgi:hypothetical protein
MGFAALGVDVGMVLVARTELQAAADAAALAGAYQLADQSLTAGAPDLSDELLAARSAAVDAAALNACLRSPVAVESNFANDPAGDIVLGTLTNSFNLAEPLSFADPDQFNSVQVRVRRDSAAGNAIPLFFGRVLGSYTANVSAQATATLPRGPTGFRAVQSTAKSKLLPFALDQATWLAVVAGATSDNWSWDPVLGVQPGGDGVREADLYPEPNVELPPGNRGTVDIGGADNSSAVIKRQILEGVNANDLAYHGGKLGLNESGFVLLTGDTGISAGFKEELAAIKGDPRIIPIFSSVMDPGNNATYTIVQFAGVRILDVVLTGNSRHVIIQPAIVIDSTAVVDGPGFPGAFIYGAPRLTR